MNRKQYNKEIQKLIKPEFLPFFQTIEEHTTAGQKSVILIYNVLAEMKLSGCTFGSYEVFRAGSYHDICYQLKTKVIQQPLTGWGFVKGINNVEEIQPLQYATDYPFLQSVAASVRKYGDSIAHIEQAPKQVTSHIVESRIGMAKQTRRYI